MFYIWHGLAIISLFAGSFMGGYIIAAKKTAESITNRKGQ